jgi:transglutaminase-like putative cysteine protease
MGSADMTLEISVGLEYWFDQPTDLMLQIEAAILPEQTVERAHIDVGQVAHFARTPAHDNIGERIWLRTQGQFAVSYSSRVAIHRIIGDIANLSAIPPAELPGETVQYLLDSTYCPASEFQFFVESEFGHVQGGARVAAMRDWIASKFVYTSGVSTNRTTALDTIVMRRGVCRDYAHVLVTLCRASTIPARFASVYAPQVEPQDFHAVAEVFLGGAWHLVDATGMALEGEMAKIGVGRDAADVSFLTAYGNSSLIAQSVQVERAII